MPSKTTTRASGRDAARSLPPPLSIVEPGPLPFQPGVPHLSRRCPAGTPPDGFEFLGAVATVRCWMTPCPCCCEGWVALTPDGSRYGYAMEAEAGCSAGCAGPEISWWHLSRLGELPSATAGPIDHRASRYAKACVRRQLAELPERPDEAQLRQVAYQIGRWLEAGDLPIGAVANTLLAAAERSGLDRAALAPRLAAAVSAGRAQPGRLPR
jgi:hypothetical protein